MDRSRRKFIHRGGTLGLGLGVLPILSCQNTQSTEASSAEDSGEKPVIQPIYKISLAEWSFNKSLFAGEMDNLEFAAKSKSLGFEGVEYVNQFFKDKAEDKTYLDQMNTLAADNDIQNVLIMIDGEGNLGMPDDQERMTAVDNHKKWVEAAQYLGCHSIRVNAFGVGTADEVKSAAIDALGKLAEFAVPYNINIVVENHGGYSSDGQWLADVMTQINLDNCGTLPDFGNFCIKREGGAQWGAPCIEEYDKYKGVEEMMPFAKAVSAKAYAFDEDGNETTIDFQRMIKIVVDAGYRGFVGVEYEGEMGEEEGIIATKTLLEKIRDEVTLD